jgi:hypothetical protein
MPRPASRTPAQAATAKRAARPAPEHAAVPAALLTRLRRICLALPGAYEEPAWVGTRWMVRKRNFAHLVAIAGGWPPAYARAAGSDGPLVVLTFRTDAALADVLRTSAPRFFFAAWGTRWGTKVIGLKLERGVDWGEVAMLVGESHRLLAPAPVPAPGPAAARPGTAPPRPAASSRRRR